ncbi:MAG: polyphosphate kinase 2 family protein [Thermoanaerobaculia bacterium]
MGKKTQETLTAQMLKQFAVLSGKGFRLRDVDPRDTMGLKEKDARDALARAVARLADLQERLYAQDKWGVLVIFQAMDAAGKDGAISHVMSGVNPQGCQVFSFKAPSAEELDHDFLWRTSKCLPERGRIGIFNRSYYEETLVVRVHPPIFAAQRLPREVVSKSIWEERLEDIASFERYFARQGYLILKFFLHISRAEQKKRFLARLDEPEKNWKFALGDVREREHLEEYMKAYEAAIRATATPHAPWFVVPADHKWFTRLVISETIVAAIEGLDLAWPKSALSPEDLAAARKALAED